MGVFHCILCMCTHACLMHLKVTNGVGSPGIIHGNGCEPPCGAGKQPQVLYKSNM